MSKEYVCKVYFAVKGATTSNYFSYQKITLKIISRQKEERLQFQIRMKNLGGLAQKKYLYIHLK